MRAAPEKALCDAAAARWQMAGGDAICSVLLPERFSCAVHSLAPSAPAPPLPRPRDSPEFPPRPVWPGALGVGAGGHSERFIGGAFAPSANTSIGRATCVHASTNGQNPRMSGEGKAEECHGDGERKTVSAAEENPTRRPAGSPRALPPGRPSRRGCRLP